MGASFFLEMGLHLLGSENLIFPAVYRTLPRTGGKPCYLSPIFIRRDKKYKAVALYPVKS
jgi:hypothetical protein